MFDFIGNTIRNIVNDIEWELTDISLKKAQEDFDKWEEGYKERCREIDALDPGSKEARTWCIENEQLPDSMEKKLDSFDFVTRHRYRPKAISGMCDALAAFRSIMYNDEEGFVTWPKEDRILETSIRFFFGKSRYENYDDFSDSEVPKLVEYMDFDNPYGNIISDDMLEEAFRRVQGSDLKVDIKIDVRKNFYEYIPVKLPSGIDAPDSIIVDRENQIDPDDPNIIDAEVIDGKAVPVNPIHEEEEKTHTVRFYSPENDDDICVIGYGVDMKVQRIVEEAIAKTGFGQKRRMYQKSKGPNTGFFELCFQNGSTVVIDPGVVAGTGVNLVASARIPGINGGWSFVSALVNIDKDIDIAKKIFENPEYVLNEEEHKRVSSRLYPKMEIYDYVDFTGMSDEISALSERDNIILGRKLGAIVNLMIDGTAPRARLRFMYFGSPDSFTLISDDLVKFPMMTNIREVVPIAFIVEGDEISYNKVNATTGKIGASVGSYDIEYEI